MERACEKVCWDYLRQVLLQFGLHSKFVYWVMAHPPIGFILLWVFSDCPLSPYLFIMCSEFLSCDLNFSLPLRLLFGLTVNREGRKLNHLMYTDDCIVFARATAHEARVLWGVIEQYCELSRQ